MPTPLLVVLVAAVVGGAVFYFLRGKQPAKAAPPAPRPKVAAPLPVAGPKLNWLLGRAGPVADKAYHVGSRTATIGRTPENFIQIEDPSVGRVHAIVSFDAQRAVLSRLKDGHEVLVNGQSIQTHTLKSGDEIRMGAATFEFQASGDYGENAALGRKAATSATRAETRAANSEEFQAMLRDKLDQCNWDVEAAAKTMGVETSFLEQLIKVHGMKRGGADQRV